MKKEEEKKEKKERKKKKIEILDGFWRDLKKVWCEDEWRGGWMGVKAVLRIAYSNH